MGSNDADRLVFTVPSTARIAVEFPGYVRNVDRATRMLGGLEGVAAAVNSRHQAGGFLRVSFRPDDPTCHPLIGEHLPARGLLLRISRKRVAVGDVGTAAAAAGGGAHAAAPEPPTVQLVATVSSTFRFSGLADYQFLPVDPSAALRNQHVDPDVPPVPPENLAGAAGGYCWGGSGVPLSYPMQ
jgi:general transcription factor 3C polypeptide 5 (transcription factor C subunit 1)